MNFPSPEALAVAKGILNQAFLQEAAQLYEFDDDGNRIGGVEVALRAAYAVDFPEAASQ